MAFTNVVHSYQPSHRNHRSFHRGNPWTSYSFQLHIQLHIYILQCQFCIYTWHAANFDSWVELQRMHDETGGLRRALRVRIGFLLLIPPTAEPTKTATATLLMGDSYSWIHMGLSIMAGDRIYIGYCYPVGSSLNPSATITKSHFAWSKKSARRSSRDLSKIRRTPCHFWGEMTSLSPMSCNDRKDSTCFVGDLFGNFICWSLLGLHVTSYSLFVLLMISRRHWFPAPFLLSYVCVLVSSSIFQLIKWFRMMCWSRSHICELYMLLGWV